MPDNFTSSTTTSYGGRVADSFKAALSGILLIVVAFGLLYWNEGRKDLSLLAQESKVLGADYVTTDTSLQNKLVSVTAKLTSQEHIGDGFFLKPGNYIQVQRKAEMYAWVETTHTETRSGSGGSQTQTTTYSYNKKWTDRVSDGFAHPDGHENPPQKITNSETRVDHATVGVYTVGNIQRVALPMGTPVSLSTDNTILTGAALLASQDYVFIPFVASSSQSSIASPQLGDLRISYTTVNSGINATIFGKLEGSSIQPYFDRDNNQLYRIFTGTRDEAISQLHHEHKVLTWVLRGAGFLLMLFGFLMLTSPITTILGIIPIVGGITNAIVLTVSIILSVILSVTTILVSMFLHSIIALIIAIVLVLGVTIFWFKMRKTTSTT